MDKIGIVSLANRYFEAYDKNKDNKISLESKAGQDSEAKFVDMQYTGSAKNKVMVTTTDESEFLKKADLNGDKSVTREELTKFISDNYDKGNKGYLSGSKSSAIPILRMFIDTKDGEIDKFNQDFKAKTTTKTLDISDIPEDKRKDIRNYRSGG